MTILKCITNWTAQVTGARSTKDKRGSFPLAMMGPHESEIHSMIQSHQFQAGLADPNLLSGIAEETTITLLGPPKEYYGENTEDRYAYVLHEAVSLLQRKGFGTNLTFLMETKSQIAKNHKKVGKHYRRVPGILGFFLNDMTSDTQIAVFEPISGDLVAHLGFRTFKQPWLNVCCRSSAETESIENLHKVLSKRFFLIKIPHECKTFSIPVKPTGPLETIDTAEMGSLVVKMTTGNIQGLPYSSKTREEELCTKFVFEKENGEPVARALWSFANDRLDSVGPAMELFESMGSRDTDLGLVLSTMENKMVEFVAPLVAFSLRLCKVEDPSACRWLARRGYTDTTGDGTGTYKAFVVF